MSNRLRYMRYSAIGIGAALLAGAIIPDLQSFNGLGPVQSVLLVAGIVSILWGLLGRNIGRFYANVSMILMNTVLVILLLDTGLGLVKTGLDKLESRQGLSDSAQNELHKANHPYYSAQSWRESFWNETNSLGQEYYPFVMWREIPQSGDFVNVNDDSRRVVPGTHCDSEDAYTVYLLGGSTMFGIGAPDEMTIGAFLQPKLQQEIQTDVCTVVLASNGWVSTQSVIELIRLLQVGGNPDLVIFYDGFNDSLAAANSGIPNGDYSNGKVAANFDVNHSQNLGRWFLTSTLMGQTLAEWLGIDTAFDADYRPPAHIKQPIRDVDRLAQEVSQTYLTNYRVVEAIAQRFDFEFAFFWQPALGLGNKPLTPFEEELMELYDDRFPVFEAVYDDVRTAAPEYTKLHVITDVFANTTETLYFDPVHVIPDGNEIVAQQIVQRILPQLKTEENA